MKIIKYEFGKCHKCAYKDSVPGSAHISCLFNWPEALNNSQVPYIPVGVLHGIQQGWFYFPFNYDPIWMAMPCPAFEKRGTDKSELNFSDEKGRLVMSLLGNNKAMEKKMTQEQFDTTIGKYNKKIQMMLDADKEESDDEDENNQ